MSEKGAGYTLKIYQQQNEKKLNKEDGDLDSQMVLMYEFSSKEDVTCTYVITAPFNQPAEGNSRGGWGDETKLFDRS